MEFAETMLENYSQPLSTTEDALCKNAIRMVRDALKPLGFTDDNKDIASLYSDTLAYSIEMRSIYGSRKTNYSFKGHMLITPAFAQRVMLTLQLFKKMCLNLNIGLV